MFYPAKCHKIYTLIPGLLALVLLLCSVPLQHLAKEESDVSSRSEGAPPPRMARLKRYLASWYEWYGDLEEWLDEVLPPASEHDLLVGRVGSGGMLSVGYLGPGKWDPAHFVLRDFLKPQKCLI